MITKFILSIINSYTGGRDIGNIILLTLVSVSVKSSKSITMSKKLELKSAI